MSRLERDQSILGLGLDLWKQIHVNVAATGLATRINKNETTETICFAGKETEPFSVSLFEG